MQAKASDMDLFNKLFSQLRALWNRWSVGQRAGMVVALLASAATVGSVGFWASQPQYVFLSDRLGPQEAAEAVSVLQAAGIRYQLNYSGSAVSVPQADLNRARLALKDVLTAPAQDGSDLTEGIWSDPALHQARMTRQLEQRLARSISQISAVRNATVHLTPGQSTPFLRDRVAAKASVILELQPQATFTSADARAVVSLVAHSVESLDPENVSVLDTTGRLLSASQGVDADVTGQLSYRSRIEGDLAAKAETILTQMLGPGRAVVRVTADIDFTETQRKEIKYDPELKVKVSETIHSESHSGGGKSSGGAAGASTNIDPLAFKAGGGSGATKTESNTTTFENAKTEDTVREAPGRIKRLTIAAVVQLPDAAAAGSNGQSAPPIQQAQVEKIIKQAVGFDSARQDEIEVLVAPLAGNMDLQAPPVAAPGWEQYESLLRNVSLGLASLVALGLGLMVIRRMKPIVVETESKDVLPAESILKLAEIAQQARENPEAVATVIRSWLNLPAASAAPLPQSKRKVA
jgi:flagellar M-ring protein FliF